MAAGVYEKCLAGVLDSSRRVEDFESCLANILKAKQAEFEDLYALRAHWKLRRGWDVKKERFDVSWSSPRR